MILRHTWRSALLAGGETTLILSAVAVTTFVLAGADAPFVLSSGQGLVRVLLIVLVCQLCLHYADLYDLRMIAGARDLLTRLLQALGATSILLAVLYFVFPDWIVGRGVWLYATVLVMLLVVSWRAAFAWFTRYVAPTERLLVVGTSTAADDLARELVERRQEIGVEIVGFVDVDPARAGERVMQSRVIGTIEDIPTLIHALHVDRVVVNVSDGRGRLPMDRLLDMRLRHGVSFDHLASVYEEYTGKIAVENLRPSWIVFSKGFRNSSMHQAVKRVFDVLLAAVGLLVAMPVMALAAAAVTLTSNGPALYRQQRVGLYGRTFTVHKIRTMGMDAEAASGPVWSRPNDDRITRVGRILRRTRLDELPQLWNVLVGDMSLVGPRPERPCFVEELTSTIPFYGQRHVVKPGLTGWAQVRYTYGASVEDAVQKLQYDLFYIKHLSIAFDFLIIFETIKTVVLRRGAQ